MLLLQCYCYHFYSTTLLSPTTTYNLTTLSRWRRDLCEICLHRLFAHLRFLVYLTTPSKPSQKGSSFFFCISDDELVFFLVSKIHGHRDLSLLLAARASTSVSASKIASLLQPCRLLPHGSAQGQEHEHETIGQCSGGRDSVCPNICFP